MATREFSTIGHERLHNPVLQKIDRETFIIGYDRLSGYLKGGMHTWEIEGMTFDRIGAVHAEALEPRQKPENH